jgi:Tol biopolymer transport system component
LIELFVADLGEGLAHADHDLICGTESTRPLPPTGVRQRRLTFTQARRFPGIRGPRHWPRSHPDGSQIATLMLDDHGIAQLFLVSTQTGQYRQLTSLAEGIMGAFSWSPDGESIACLSDHRCCIIDSSSGELRRATEHYETIRPEACVFSPDGRAVAFVARFRSPSEEYNQIVVARLA